MNDSARQCGMAARPSHRLGAGGRHAGEHGDGYPHGAFRAALGRDGMHAFTQDCAGVVEQAAAAAEGAAARGGAGGGAGQAAGPAAAGTALPTALLQLAAQLAMAEGGD